MEAVVRVVRVHAMHGITHALTRRTNNTYAHAKYTSLHISAIASQGKFLNLHRDFKK